MRWNPSMPRLPATTTLLLLLATACSSDDGTAADGSGSGSSGSSTSTTGVASDPGATSVVSGQGSSTGSSTTPVDPDSSGGMDSIGFISAGSSSSGGPVGPLPDGGFCQVDDECESGHCLAIDGVGGVCSECEMDADCEMGTCTFEILVGYSICTDGSAGVDCESDRGCAEGLVCAPVFGDDGFSPTRCSECSPDVPCPAGQGCALITDNGLLDAYLGCIDAGTVPLGETCPVVDGVGDGTICTSGQCGVIDVFGFQIGVCSECDADDDCMMGQTCSPPGFDMGMLTPGTCG
jgi:hypothetical protein